MYYCSVWVGGVWMGWKIGGWGWRKEPIGYVCDMEGNWMRGEEQEGCVAGGGER